MNFVDLLTCQEVIMILDQYTKDFKSLIERLQLMRAYENADEGSRSVCEQLVSVFVCLSVAICLCPYLSVYVSVCLSGHHAVCLSVSLSHPLSLYCIPFLFSLTQLIDGVSVSLSCLLVCFLNLKKKYKVLIELNSN